MQQKSPGWFDWHNDARVLYLHGDRMILKNAGTAAALTGFSTKVTVSELDETFSMRNVQ